MGRLLPKLCKFLKKQQDVGLVVHREKTKREHSIYWMPLHSAFVFLCNANTNLSDMFFSRKGDKGVKLVHELVIIWARGPNGVREREKVLSPALQITYALIQVYDFS